MPEYRSPSFLFAVAGVFFAAGVAAWLLGGENIVTWVCLLLAFPPAFEHEVSRRAAWIAAMAYDRREKEVEQHAYEPIGSLLRCCYLFVFFSLAYGLGRGGLNLLPDNGWAVAFILVPIAIHLIWAGVACWRNVASVAKREGWQRRRPAKFGR